MYYVVCNINNIYIYVYVYVHFFKVYSKVMMMMMMMMMILLKGEFECINVMISLLNIEIFNI